jgi:hypothetical protein
VAKKQPKVTKIDRTLAEKSSEWKLPPNVYHNLGNDITTNLKQQGKLGPYQCFTVERDDRTVRNHFAPKPADECCETDFYDLPSLMYDGAKAWNAHKNKFLKCDRFVKIKNNGVPPPTKYYPQNFTIKSSLHNASKKSSTKKAIEVNPVFYYPQTTVPEREMDFHKTNSCDTPEPSRYNPRQTVTFRSQKAPSRKIHAAVDDMTVNKRQQHEAISFRVKRSSSVDDLYSNCNREIRFNTMIKRRNLFSVKTGRPVGFLCASPRFNDSSERPIQLYEKTRKSAMDEDATDNGKPKVKRMTQKRLDELATPKHALPKCVVTERIQVLTKLPPPSTLVAKNLAENLNIAAHKSHSDIHLNEIGMKQDKSSSSRQTEK